MDCLELDKIIGMQVRHPDGQSLGWMDNVCIDPASGRIERATLRLRVNQNLRVTVPWSQLRLSKADDCIELDVTQQTLEAVASRRAANPNN